MRFKLALAALLLGAVVNAAPTVFERPLPTTGINGPGNSPNRNNASIIQTGSLLYGDDFSFTGTAFALDTLTIYAVGNSLSTSLADEFSSINLYLGPNDINFVPQLDATPYTNPTITRVYYNGTDDYEDLDNPGTFYPLYAITFNLNGFVASPEVLYSFAVDATAVGSNTFALHVTRDLGAAGASGTVSGYTFGAPPVYDAEYQVSNFDDGNNAPDFLNDVDANVVITGNAVPEPSTFGLIGIGIGVLALRLRRK